MSFRKIPFALILFFAGWTSTGLLFAHSTPGTGFIENKGQWPSPVRFMTTVSGGYMWFGTNAFRVKLAPRTEHHGGQEEVKAPFRKNSDGHAYEIRFPGGNPTKVESKGKTLKTLYNFYLGQNPKEWATGAKAFEELYYTNMYPGVDIRIYRQSGHLKYDLNLAKAQEIRNVRIRYEGLDGILLSNGNLKLKTSVGVVEESIPLAYQLIAGKRKTISCRFVLEKNEVRFAFPNGYDANEPLVVDPQIIFYTYSGGESDNWGNTAVGDPFGNSYLAGTVYGPEFPTTLGAFDPDYNGAVPYHSSYDIGIQKFDPTGSELLVSTFLGGDESDTPHSINLDKDDNLIVLGSTSSLDFPVGANAFQPVYGGGNRFIPLSNIQNAYRYDNGSDIIVAKLEANGNTLLGSTFLGGSQNDGVVAWNDSLSMNYGDAYRGDVAVAPDGSILIASATYSPDFPTTATVHQPNLQNSMDGVVVRLNAGLTQVIWSTFLGGSSLDALYSIQIQGTDKVVVCGGTKSQDFPFTTGAYQSSITGQNTKRNSFCDAVVASFSLATGLLQHSTYSGTSSYDQAYLVQTDEAGNVYIFGQTEGQMPKSPGRFGQDNGRIFLQKFNPELTTLLWGTTLGNTVNSTLVPSAFLVDTCGRIYISGWGGNSNFPAPQNTGGNTGGFSVTPNAFKTLTDGSDFYFCVLGPDAQTIDFGSYYGGGFRGEHVDGGMSRFDKSGIITQAICGCRDQSGFFAGTAGSYSPNIKSDNCNQGVVKINLGILLARFDFNAELICGRTINLENRSTNGTRYTWFWGNGDSLSTNSTNVVYTYPDTGTYIITLKATNLATCKRSDSFSDTITIRNVFPFEPDTLEKKVCTKTTFYPEIPSFPGIIRTWSPDPDIVNGNNTRPLLNPTIGKIYTIENRTENGCLLLSYYKVNLLSDLVLRISDSLDLEKCDSSGVLFLRAVSNGSEWYRWRVNNQTAVGNETTFQVTGTTNRIEVQLNGFKNTCPDSIQKEIPMPAFYQKVVPDFSVSELVESCEAKTVRFTNRTIRAETYAWDFGDGTQSAEVSPSHVYSASGTYLTTLKASNGNCEASASQWVTYSPLVIPNLITSNQDEKNDAFVVSGLVEGTHLEVFNRWGKKIYSSPSYQNNWRPTDLEPGTYFFQLRFPGGKACHSWVEIVQ